jgi:hypothetical protein
MRSIQPVIAWAPSTWPLTWLSKHVSANGSMDPALLAKVYGMNFGRRPVLLVSLLLFDNNLPYVFAVECQVDTDRNR